MSKTASPPPASPSTKKQVSRFITFLLCLIPLALVFRPTAAIIIVGLIPSYVAFMVDRDPKKYTATAVAALNMVGILPVLIKLWTSGHSLSAVGELLSSPFNWAMMFSGAAVGWVLMSVIPALMVAIMMGQDKIKLSQIKARQKQMLEEWGPELNQSSPAPKSLAAPKEKEEAE